MALNESLNQGQESLEIKDSTKSQDQNGKQERERSTIDFPYGDLDDATKVAKGVHEVGGLSCTWEQLAAHLGHGSANSGGFRQRALTAKTFGLVEYGQGKIALTNLGGKVCDPKQEAAAKSAAFLVVPLYLKLYENFKGNALPPSGGLESEMITLGVAKKQAGKARQVFMRSANQAGFFAYGQDRLVLPSTKEDVGSKPTKEQEEGSAAKLPRKGEGDSGEPRHPLIEGLIKTLPAPETDWPIQGRWKWLLAASNIFSLIYTDTADDGTSLSIEIKKGSA